MPTDGSASRHTYILRIWGTPTSPDGEHALRIVLEEVRSRRRAGFDSLDALVEYLRALNERDGLLLGLPQDDSDSGAVVPDERRP
jgi:hypothetical protein